MARASMNRAGPPVAHSGAANSRPLLKIRYSESPSDPAQCQGFPGAPAPRPESKVPTETHRLRPPDVWLDVRPATLAARPRCLRLSAVCSGRATPRLRLSAARIAVVPTFRTSPRARPENRHERAKSRRRAALPAPRQDSSRDEGYSPRRRVIGPERRTRRRIRILRRLSH